MIAILVTLIAGLSTVIGAVLVSHVRKNTFEVVSLAFATGIMLMISIGELLPESMEVLGIPLTLLLFVAGALMSLLLDIIVPHHHDDDDDDDHLEGPGHFIDECECTHSETISYGMIIALLLHNIIEGLATGVTVVSDARLGMSMALGIALHNIPIGATLAISVRSAGGKRSKAILASALVGLSQPVGAIIGVLFFQGNAMTGILSACMAIVAGILVFISFDELWPAARLSGSRKLTIFALLVGMCFIPLTEALI